MNSDKILKYFEIETGQTKEEIKSWKLGNCLDLVQKFADNHLKKQLLLYGVGSSLPKVCKGCGSLSTKVIDKKYVACCPDSNYIPMEDYCKNSIYPDKQF
jgi:hypothetical protein